jgi:hypothetical protein
MITLISIDEVLQYPREGVPGFVSLSECVYGEERLQRVFALIYCSEEFLAILFERRIETLADIQLGDSGYFEVRPVKSTPLRVEGPVMRALSPLGIWELCTLGIVLKGTPYAYGSRLVGEGGCFWATYFSPVENVSRELAELHDKGWELSESGRDTLTKVFEDLVASSPQ